MLFEDQCTFYAFSTCSIHFDEGIGLTVESDLIISVLRLTRGGSCLAEDIKTESRLPTDVMMKLLKTFQNENLLKLNRTRVETDTETRLKLAVKALSLGADVETVAGFLRWQEFESFAAAALESYGYSVKKNLHFKNSTRRWELDVVGCKKPFVVCVDCKNWHRSMKPSAMIRVVEAQVERTKALSDAMPSMSSGLECYGWKRAKFLPVIIVLIENRFRFWDGVPVVAVLQLNDFLAQLPFEFESMKYFKRNLVHLSD